MTVTLSIFLLLVVVTAGVAIVDGVRRTRGRSGNSFIAILEIVFAALLLIAQFVGLPAPLGNLLFSVLLEITLVVLLLVPGTKTRAGGTLTVIALILNGLIVLMSAGWLHIPGIN